MLPITADRCSLILPPLWICVKMGLKGLGFIFVILWIEPGGMVEEQKRDFRLALLAPDSAAIERDPAGRRRLAFPQQLQSFVMFSCGLSLHRRRDCTIAWGDVV